MISKATKIGWDRKKNFSKTISIEKKTQLLRAHANHLVFRSCHNPMKEKIIQTLHTPTKHHFRITKT